MSYLSVRNWERYQHYRDRRPIWIKFYVELLDDVELRRLPVATRLLWDQILLLAARLDNAIPNDAEELSFLTRIPQKAVAVGIKQLVAGRWLSEKRSRSAASKMLAKRYQDASNGLADPEQIASPRARPRAHGETEEETETKTEKEPAKEQVF